MDCHWLALAATDSLLTSAASLLTLYLLLPTLPTSTDLYWLSTGKKGGGPVNNLQKGLSAMLLNRIPGHPAAEVDGQWWNCCTMLSDTRIYMKSTEIHFQCIFFKWWPVRRQFLQSIPSQARTVSYFLFNKQLSFLNKLLLKTSVISSCPGSHRSKCPLLEPPFISRWYL